MSNYVTRIVKDRQLQQVKVHTSLRPNGEALTDEQLLKLEKRVQAVIAAGAAWLAKFPAISSKNFDTLKDWLVKYFKLTEFNQAAVDTINAVLNLTRTGLAAQRAQMVIKVAPLGNIGGEGDTPQHGVLSDPGEKGLKLPEPTKVARPGESASSDLLKQMGGRLVKMPTRAGAARPYKYIPGDGALPADRKPMRNKPERTFVVENRNGQTFCWAYGDIHMIYDLFDDWEPKGHAVLTFVHEATHKFANTQDKGYYGYHSGKWDKDPPQAEALVNADSYAWLLYHFNSGESLKEW